MSKKRAASRRRIAAGHEASGRGFSGEKLLEWWASQEGISATRTDRDVGGWDITLDVPTIPSSHPLDLQIPPTIARVQVKTKKRDFKSTIINVKTACAMALQPVPWFIIAIVMPGKDPTRVYVVHIGEDRIANILRAARAAENNDAAEITISWTAADAISSTTGHAVFEAVRERIGDVASYAEQKSAFVRNVGYDANAAVVRMRVEATEEALEAVIDLGLGLRSRASVNELSLHDQRFGMFREIEKNVDTELEASGSIAPIALCVLQVISDNEWAELDFELITMQRVLPREIVENFKCASKSVMRHPYLDLVIKGSIYQRFLHFSNPLSLHMAGRVARFLRLLSRSQRAVCTVQRSNEEPRTVEMEFTGIGINSAERPILTAMEAAARVSQLAETSDSLLPLAYFISSWHQLILVAGFLNVADLGISRIRGTPKMAITHDNLIIGLPATLGTVNILLYLHVFGERTDGELRVHSVAPVGRHVSPLSTPITEDTARELLRRCATERRLDALLVTPAVFRYLDVFVGGSNAVERP